MQQEDRRCCTARDVRSTINEMLHASDQRGLSVSYCSALGYRLGQQMVLTTVCPNSNSIVRRWTTISALRLRRLTPYWFWGLVQRSTFLCQLNFLPLALLQQLV